MKKSRRFELFLNDPILATESNVPYNQKMTPTGSWKTYGLLMPKFLNHN